MNGVLERLVAAALLAGAVTACGGHGGRGAPASPEAAPLPPLPPFASSLDRAHPLSGRIWATGAARFVSERELRRALHGYVLLGEKHDNPDHHVLQARLVDAMRESGRRPVVAFEMLDESAQERLDAAHARAPEDVARAVDWEHSGWPPFAIYAPVFRAALATSMPLVATGLPPATMRAIVRGKETPPGLATPAPLDAAATSSLREELARSHCGHLPESMVDGMIRAQRVRDATMAEAMVRALQATSATDAVLVAGTGHTRRDRGVPKDLAARDPSRPVTSIAFVEVEHDRMQPGDYAERFAATALPFDFVWFTPRASDEDPCAGMR